MNLFTLLDKTATHHPDLGAAYKGTECVLTYSELKQQALQLAGKLAASGKPGDRIVVASKNSTDYLVIMFGIWAAGMTIAPVNAKLHAKEIADIINDAEATWVFASNDLAGPLKEYIEAPDKIIAIGSKKYQEFIKHEPVAPVNVGSDDISWLFYTSGTTGRSKGAMLTNRNLMAMAIAHLADFEDLSPGDSIIHAAPMSHGSGLFVLPYISRGARHIIPITSSYDPAEFLDLCDAHPNCGAFLAPTMVQRLRLESEARNHHPKGLRSIIYGGGPMYLDEIKKSLAHFGPIFRQLYGQGESPMTITGLRQQEFINVCEDQLASVGWARSGVELRIVDTEGKTVPTGETGEILCRGDVVMSGYWNNPDATEATLKNGWLHTGDVGSVDKTGLLTLRDRIKDVIISGGTNIYPREVEEVLLTHPNIREVAVIGCPDSEWGESIVAFIVQEQNALIDQSLLDKHCLANMARFKRPKHYIFLDNLPKNSSGKVLKRELKQHLSSL